MGNYTNTSILYSVSTKTGQLLDKLTGVNGDIRTTVSFDNGYVYANDKPGLGVDLNEEEAAKYPCENTVTTWTQTRRRDGALQTP